MLRDPVPSVVVVSCAVQLWAVVSCTHDDAGTSRLVTPSLNWTVPSGVSPVPSVGVTVAVNVIESPWKDGLSDDTRAVVVLNRSPVVVAVVVSTSLTLAVVLETVA